MNTSNRSMEKKWFSRKKKVQQSNDAMQRVQEQKVFIDVGADRELLIQMNMIDLTEQDLFVLQSIDALIREHIDEITASFYNSVTNVDNLKRLIEEHSTIERLSATLKKHILEMFHGVVDVEYIAKRLRIAEVHQRIGLEPKWYMGAFQSLQNTLLDIVHRRVPDRDESLRMVKIITKMLNLEQQIVLEAYDKGNIRQKELHYNQIKEQLKNNISVLSEELAILTEQTSSSVQQLVAMSNEVNASLVQGVANSIDTASLASSGKINVQQLDDNIAGMQTSIAHMEEKVC